MSSSRISIAGRSRRRLAATLALVPIVIMIIYLSGARALGAFEAL